MIPTDIQGRGVMGAFWTSSVTQTTRTMGLEVEKNIIAILHPAASNYNKFKSHNIRCIAE